MTSGTKSAPLSDEQTSVASAAGSKNEQIGFLRQLIIDMRNFALCLALSTLALTNCTTQNLNRTIDEGSAGWDRLRCGAQIQGSRINCEIGHTFGVPFCPSCDPIVSYCATPEGEFHQLEWTSITYRVRAVSRSRDRFERLFIREGRRWRRLREHEDQNLWEVSESFYNGTMPLYDDRELMDEMAIHCLRDEIYRSSL